MEKPLGSIDVGEEYFVGFLAEGAFAWFLGNWHVFPRLLLQSVYRQVRAVSVPDGTN
jgi:hypothetical protein